MKTKHIFAILLSVLTIGAFAQGPGTNERRGGDPAERAARMKAEMEKTIVALELNDKQAEEFRAINEKYADEGKKLREEIAQGSIQREEAREIMMDMGLERDDEIREILTKDQWKKYKKLQRERQQQWQQGGGQGRPGGGQGGGPGGGPMN